MTQNTDYNKKYICKDCVHSKADWLTKITKQSSGFQCTLLESYIPGSYDPVTGITSPSSFNNCSTMRAAYNEVCGPDAKKWKPKSTKLVFLLLKK